MTEIVLAPQNFIKQWLDPSLNLRIEHHTLSNLHGSELRDYWYNVARDPDNLRFLRYRNSTGKVVIRNGKLYGIYLDIETEITCHNAHFISSSTAGYTQQATFKAFVNWELVATRSRKVLDCPIIDTIYRVVADSFRKKFPNIDTLEVFISPFKTDYRTVVKGK